MRDVLAETFAGRQKIVQLNQVCLSKGFEIGQAYAPAMAGALTAEIASWRRN